MNYNKAVKIRKMLLKKTKNRLTFRLFPASVGKEIGPAAPGPGKDFFNNHGPDKIVRCERQVLFL